MRTVYLASRGSYSDYSVLAIFDKKKDAKKWVGLHNQTGGFYDEAFVEERLFFDEGEAPEKVRFVTLWANVKEDGSVDEREPTWHEEWSAGWYGDVPPKGRAVGRTWTAPAWGRGLAIQVSARTENLARKSFHDRITQAKTLVPVPRGKEVNIK